MIASVSTISGELGGNMGLLLDCSLLTICEFFDFLWESIKSRISRPNEQNSVSSSDFSLKLSVILFDLQIYGNQKYGQHIITRTSCFIPTIVKSSRPDYFSTSHRQQNKLLRLSVRLRLSVFVAIVVHYLCCQLIKNTRRMFTSFTKPA